MLRLLQSIHNSIVQAVTLVFFGTPRHFPLLSCTPDNNMSTIDSNIVELDFEDKLAKFEENFSQCDRGRLFYSKRSDKRKVRHRIGQAPMSFSEIEPELRVLWKELVNCVPTLQNMARTSTDSNETDVAGRWLRSDIGREIFKSEIRTTLSQVRNFQTASYDEMDELSSSQNAKVRSLKRILSERTEELEALKRRYRQVDNQKHRLQETVEELTGSVTTCKRTHSPMENEIGDLREQNAGLQKRLFDHEEGAKRFGAERLRFQSTIARYREELQLANHQTETAELELAQAKQTCEELEKRARETKASSSAVSARVKELQDVQDAMLKVMQNAKDTTDPGSVRRNLQDLGEKRSRLVGRIANLLTKNRQSGTGTSNPAVTESNTESVPAPSTDTGTNHDGTASSPAVQAATEPSTRGFNNSGNSSDTITASNELDTGNRNPFLDGIRKLGNDLTKVKTNRNRNELTRMASPRLQRKSILDNVEKSRAAIENDVTLREVIELKEKELERMEDELYIAKEKAAALERSLQKERHKRRLENRTISAAPGEQLSVEASSVVLTRRRSLFDWQSSDRAKRASSDVQNPGDELVQDKDSSTEKYDDIGIERASY